MTDHDHEDEAIVHGTVDKADLFQQRLPERDVEIPGVGWVRVRALTRAEAFQVQRHEGDTAAMERAMLHFGMVDPAMSHQDCKRWHEASAAAEMEVVTDVIAELSGMEKGARSDIRGEFREEP